MVRIAGLIFMKSARGRLGMRLHVTRYWHKVWAGSEPVYRAVFACCVKRTMCVAFISVLPNYRHPVFPLIQGVRLYASFDDDTYHHRSAKRGLPSWFPPGRVKNSFYLTWRSLRVICPRLRAFGFPETVSYLFMRRALICTTRTAPCNHA
jgi:hypothetical protein